VYRLKCRRIEKRMNGREQRPFFVAVFLTNQALTGAEANPEGFSKGIRGFDGRERTSYSWKMKAKAHKPEPTVHYPKLGRLANARYAKQLTPRSISTSLQLIKTSIYSRSIPCFVLKVKMRPFHHHPSIGEGSKFFGRSHLRAETPVQ